MSAITQPTPPVQTPARPSPALAPPPPKKSTHTGLVIGLILVAGAAGAWLYTRSSSPPNPAVAAGVKTAKAQAGPIMLSTRVAGNTSARTYANITAPSMRGREGGGSMAILFVVKGGSVVKKGEKILDIDAQGMKDHVDDLNETVRQAGSDVSKRQAEQAVEWESLQQTLRVSKANLEKAQLDYRAQEVRSDVERELLKLSVDESSGRYQQQLKDVANKKASQESEIKILKITEERHTRHRDRHLIDLTRFTVSAPIDGLVVMQTVFRGGESTQVQQGDNLNPGQAVMRIVDLRSMQVEASINQSETSVLRIGQPVTIGFDAFSGLTLRGKLYSIGALAVGGWRQQYFIRNVPIRLSIDEINTKVIPDLSAFGDIALGTSKDGVHVPIASLIAEDGKNFVMVRTAEGFEKRPVTVGDRNRTDAIIEAGVSAGDEVRLN